MGELIGFPGDVTGIGGETTDSTSPVRRLEKGGDAPGGRISF